MECLVRILLWSSVLTWTRVSSQFSRGKEVFFVNLEEGFFGCQVNETAEVLQIFKINKLCDGVSDCFRGSDENSKELKCSSKWKKRFWVCQKSKRTKTSGFLAKLWESGFWCVLPRCALCAVSCKEIGAFGHKMLPLGGKWLLVQFSELFNFSSNLKLARLLSYGILRFVEHKFTQQRENTLKIKICFHVQLAVANGFSAKILMRPESRFGKCPASFPGWESFAVLLYLQTEMKDAPYFSFFL